jgi:MFS family permease
MKLWTAQSVSQLGTQLGALSLTALVFLRASPAEMGILAAATGAPVVVGALLAGVWIDRVRRRPVLITADVGRALILGGVALGAALGRVDMIHLYVAGAMTGLFTLLFDLAYRSYLPGLIGRPELLEGNRRLAVSEAVAESGGNSLGGALMQTVGAPFCLAADAATFAVSGAFVAMIRAGEPATRRVAGPRRFATDVREGIRTLLDHAVLRTLAVSTVTFNFFGGFFVAVYGVFVVRELDLPVVLLGLVVGAGGLGALVGSFLVGPAARRFGLGPMIVTTRLAASATGFLTVLAGGPRPVAAAMLFASQLIGDPIHAMGDIGEMSVRQSITPDRFLGRTNAAMELLQTGAVPVGALLGGWLGSVIGARATLFIAVCAFTVRGLWLMRSPLRGYDEVPRDVTP